MLVAGIGNTDRTRDLTPQTEKKEEKEGSSGGADTFLKFISDELIPWVDKNYRTQSYRLLTGHSFGGLVAQADTFFEGTEHLNKDLYMTMGNEGGAMLGGVRKLAGVLDEHAPPDFRWNFRWMNEEDHGSVPLRIRTQSGRIETADAADGQRQILF